MLAELRQYFFLGNSLEQYALFVGTIFGGIVLVKLMATIVLARARKLAERTATQFDDFILVRLEKDIEPLLYLAVVYFSLGYLAIEPKLYKVVFGTLVTIATFFGLRLLSSLVLYLLERRWVVEERTESSLRNLRGLMTIVRVAIWGIGAVFLLDNLGFEISAIVAGLGIGGIAVALAAQTVLGDLFSYVSIFFDRPFEVGDFIIIENYMGTVEYIGIKTTRLRSLGGEQIIVSNSDLTNSRIRNYKRMAERRIVFSVGVVYGTPPAKLQEIPAIIRAAIEAVSATRVDRVHFARFGSFSLDFEAVYYVLSNDYNTYMDIQQAINLTLTREFETRDIEFAFPTQTIHMAGGEV